MLEGTKLPRLDTAQIEAMIQRTAEAARIGKVTRFQLDEFSLVRCLPGDYPCDTSPAGNVFTA